MTQFSELNFKTIFKQLGPAGVLAIIWGVLPPLGTALVIWKIEVISHWLRSNQETGPYLFAAALVILCGAGFLPTYTTCALAGWAFGFGAGLASTMAGVTLACVVGYFIARQVSGGHVLSTLGSNPKWDLIHTALLRASQPRTLFIIFLLRLAPNSPFALTNLLFGSTRVNPLLFFIGSVAGLLPRAAAVVYTASKLEKLTFSENRLHIIIGIALTIIVLLLIGAIAKRALAQAMKVGTPMQA